MARIPQTDTMRESTTGHDFLPINGTDYIEFYIGNARQSSDPSGQDTLHPFCSQILIDSYTPS